MGRFRLATALHKLGKFDEASRHAHVALELEPADPAIRKLCATPPATPPIRVLVRFNCGHGLLPLKAQRLRQAALVGTDLAGLALDCLFVPSSTQRSVDVEGFEGFGEIKFIPELRYSDATTRANSGTGIRIPTCAAGTRWSTGRLSCTSAPCS
mmetsp:Transcript_37126/g.92396  ORF Transcript_37126/g.92396 Transcript_37126/m.92396 type:complete len:154 (+) Transcript_37126:621-1082(+)